MASALSLLVPVAAAALRVVSPGECPKAAAVSAALSGLLSAERRQVSHWVLIAEAQGRLRVWILGTDGELLASQPLPPGSDCRTSAEEAAELVAALELVLQSAGNSGPASPPPVASPVIAAAPRLPPSPSPPLATNRPSAATAAGSKSQVAVRVGAELALAPTASLAQGPVAGGLLLGTITVGPFFFVRGAVWGNLEQTVATPPGTIHWAHDGASLGVGAGAAVGRLRVELGVDAALGILFARGSGVAAPSDFVGVNWGLGGAARLVLGLPENWELWAGAFAHGWFIDQYLSVTSGGGAVFQVPTAELQSALGLGWRWQ